MGVSHTLISIFSIAGVVLGAIGAIYLANGLFGKRGLAFLRMFTVALLLGILAAISAIASTIVHNPWINVSIVFITAFLSPLVDFTRKLSERQLKLLGFTLTSVGVITQFIQPVLDLLNIPIR